MTKKKTPKPTALNTYLLLALIIAMGFSTYAIFTVETAKMSDGAAPAAEPRSVAVTFLGSDCDGCFDLAVALDFLDQQEGITLTEVTNKTLEESTSLAEQYDITRLPAVIVTGDVDNLDLQNFEMRDDALVFGNVPAPYYDISSGDIKGIVTVTQLTAANCTDCFDISQIVGQLEQIGVSIAEQTVVEHTSEQGQALIDAYDIQGLPTLVFSSDIGEYDAVAQIWDNIGSVADDGSYVLRQLNPPYLNLTSGATEGLVDVTYLVDETCENCYDPSVLKDVFEQTFAMAYGEENTVSLSSTRGQFLVQKYNISLAPTIILSNEARKYPNFDAAWSQVGTTQADGNYVFTSVPLLDGYFKQTEQADGVVYKDLESGELVDTAEGNAG